MAFKILVCGSREWTDGDAIADALADFTDRRSVVVIHGDARGADRMAGEIASTFGFDVQAFPADWSRYGKRAGPIRNIEMLDKKPDMVLAFQVGNSRGTQHTINEARKRGIDTIIVRKDEDDE